MSWTCTCTLSNASLHLACGACGRERPSDEDMALRSREVIDLSGSPAPKRARREATDDLDGFLGRVREAAEDLVKTGPTRAVRAALLRVCTFNVPMGIGVNDLRTGGLVGVDLSLQDVRMRCAAKQMRHVLDDAAELCGAGAPTVFAMQEVKDVPSSAAFPTPRRVLTGMLLRELNALMSASSSRSTRSGRAPSCTRARRCACCGAGASSSRTSRAGRAACRARAASAISG